MRDRAIARALVSVVIPTYNRSALLRQTVDSVLGQTHSNLEVIVVDDGSTDDTPAVLAAYGDRIRVIRKANAGGTAARNTGIEAATGTFVNVLDHDDLFYPTKIERQLRRFAADRRLGVVHCGFDRIDAAGSLIDRRPLLPNGDLNTLLAWGCYIWSGGPLLRRAVLDDVGLFSEAAWSSDAELWLRIGLGGHRFSCVQECLGAYRVLPDSSMRDVERTEQMDMPTYERVFADPRLPEGARAIEHRAYFVQRLWLSGRYYAVGEYEPAKRNLVEALHHRPQLRDEPAQLIGELVDNALDVRVPDAIAYQQAFLANLPDELAPVIEPHAAELVGWTRTGLALRAFGQDDPVAGRALIGDAVACPEVATAPWRFVRMLLTHAGRVPADPVAYVERVYDALPPEARMWRALRTDAIAWAHWLAARQLHPTGSTVRVVRHVLGALCRRPRLVLDRRLGRILRSPTVLLWRRGW